MKTQKSKQMESNILKLEKVPQGIGRNAEYKKKVCINPDIVAQEKFGAWNNQESFIKVANYVQDLPQNCIKQYQPLFNWAQIIYDSIEFNQ